MSIDINWNTFELAVLSVCGAHLVVAGALSVVARGPRETRLVADGDRDVYELAVLHGGAPCVATAALARLYAAGCLALSRGTIVTAWRLEGEVAPIERELYEAIDLDPGVTAHSIPAAVKRGPAYAHVVAALRRDGLVPATWITASLRCLKSLVWCYMPLVVLELVAREPANLAEQPAVLSWELLGVGLLMPTVVGSVIRRAEPATRSGVAVLECHRDRVRHLDDGPVANRDLALAVALFGSEPLRRTHPEFARAWGILSPEEVQLQAAMLG